MSSQSRKVKSGFRPFITVLDRHPGHPGHPTCTCSPPRGPPPSGRRIPLHITSMMHFFHKRLWYLNSSTFNFCAETGLQSSIFLCRLCWTNQSGGRGSRSLNHHTWGVLSQTPAWSRRGAVSGFSVRDSSAAVLLVRLPGLLKSEARKPLL